MTDELPAQWKPQPVATALELMAASGPVKGRVSVDFGAAGSVGLSFDIDPTKLSREVSDGILAQIAQLSLLAARVPAADGQLAAR